MLAPSKVPVAATRPVSLIELAVVIDQPTSAGASRLVRLCRLPRDVVDEPAVAVRDADDLSAERVDAEGI